MSIYFEPTKLTQALERFSQNLHYLTFFHGKNITKAQEAKTSLHSFFSLSFANVVYTTHVLEFSELRRMADASGCVEAATASCGLQVS